MPSQQLRWAWALWLRQFRPGWPRPLVVLDYMLHFEEYDGFSAGIED